MKKRLVLFVAVIGAALAFIPSAFAHTLTFVATATCVPATGSHTVTWTVSATNLDKSPKIAESNRPAAIPVGSPLGASTPFVETGLSGSGASATIKVVWSDGYTKSATATALWTDTCAPPPPPPACPEGYSDGGVSNGVKLCTKTLPPPPPTTVWGKPVCPAGSTQTAAGDGYVVCATPAPPAPPAPPPVTIIKYGKPVCPAGTKTSKSGKGYVVCATTVTKTIIKRIKYCPVPLPCPPGMHKVWDATAKKYVCAVMGSG